MNLRCFVTSYCTVRDDSTIELKTDDVYRILSAHRRRLLLLILDDRDDGEVSVSELTREIASRETDAEPLAVPEDTYERTYVAVYQSHLPTLATANVVEWDRDAGLVRCRRPVSVLTEVIRDIDQRTK